MWIGKFAIISYLFSIALVAIGFMFASALDLSLFAGGEIIPGYGTQEDIDVLIGRHDVSGTPTSPQLIFGDFLAGARAIGDIIVSTVSGGVIADALQAVTGGITGGDWGLYILVRLLLTFSTAMLIINFITGREI